MGSSTLPPRWRVGASRHAEAALEARGTVLVADDEPGIRRAVAMMLTDVGFDVLQADTAGACIALFREHSDSIDAVMVDLEMPGGGGREVVRSLRADGHRVPVVIASGYIAETVGRELRTDPWLELLEKPFELSTLVRKLGAAIAMR